MMEFIKVSAKTVGDAIIEASIQLETSSDNVEYEILERGSTGFLGFGSRPAVISARKKEEYSSDIVPNEGVKKTEPVKKKEKVKAEVPTKQADKEPVTEAVKKTPVDKADVIAKVVGFLQNTFKAMEMEVKVEAAFDEEDNLEVELSGPEMGILIGKRGQTLDSIQYLASLVANKGNSSYVRVKVDTEDYRRRRKETLDNLAKNIASKVRRTKKPVFLEPMNPYERRIIHSALQNNPYVSTHSEGEEPYRKVVVTLKK